MHNPWGVFRALGVAVAVGAADPSDSAVLHQAPSLPAGWQASPDAVPANYNVTLHFSLRQQGVAELHEAVWRVSDPRSPSYGHYLTREEVEALTAPAAADVTVVETWLHREGLEFSRPGGELVQVALPAARAEELLHTRFHVVVNGAFGQWALRADGYKLPAEVDAATAAVYGLHGLPLPPREVLISQHPANPANVTPDVINTRYGVKGVTPTQSQKNRQAVAEFQGQTIKASDLTTFFKDYVLEAGPTDSKLYKFVGDKGTGPTGIEAGLDVEYIMGVAPAVLTEFWYWKSMDFCADLKTWTNSILAQDNPPLVFSVSYGWQGNLSKVGCKMAVVQDVDTNFAKLAARGITIIFASGDSGSGYSASCSKEDEAKNTALQGKVHMTIPALSAIDCCEFEFMAGTGWTFVPHRKPTNSSDSDRKQGKCLLYKNVTGKTTKKGYVSGGPLVDPRPPKLWPSWPASSPFVTSVGATRFVEQDVTKPEMATDQFGSGGGFSEMFPAFKEQVAAVSHYLEIAPGLPPKGSFPPGGRATPDVSALGEGFQVVASGEVTSVGGTSASAPLFAGLVSLLNEARLKAGKPAMGYLNPWLYEHPEAFTDVTIGTNAIGRGTGPLPYGFQCTKGWDPATGLGTPIFDKMLSAAMAAYPDSEVII